MRAAMGKAFERVRDALAWRIRKYVGNQIVDRTIVTIARPWRPFLRRPTFIGITGSAGKTTTKELLAGILAHQKRGIWSRSSDNRPTDVAKTILRLRPTHDFCIAELSEGRPGELDQALAILRPDIGIVTVVRNDHWTRYGSREALGREMERVVASLTTTGTAVLNADDERVFAMAANCAGKVITYGTSPAAELRAADIKATWPERLELTLAYGADRVKVRTQLCGSHWIPSVLGAVGGGLAAGLSIDDCAEGIASVEPFDGRMQPVMASGGVTFIRDDFKAPLWTMDGCFEFMTAAKATRKIIVVGELSDLTSEKKGRTYEKTATLAQEIADITVFVGPWASSVLGTRKAGATDTLRAFSHVRDASDYVNSVVRDGDLVLLKGTNKKDHLLRIIMARTGDVACWRDDCARDSFCNECSYRTVPSGLSASVHGAVLPDKVPKIPPPRNFTLDPDEQLIVGLGNPGPKYDSTPHNVGYEVVDRLAAALGLAWDTTPEAWIARGSTEGRRVCIVKVRMGMNHSGMGLRKLTEGMPLKPENCILVYDDLDIPVGSVRTRLSGGAGGHRGVTSILEAFQSDAFRRVKIGVGKTGAKIDRVEYVLTAFDAANRVTIESAIPAAETRVLEMVAAFPSAH